MNFKDIYSKIVQNKLNHDNGYFNCIPFMGMQRLEKYLPGIEQSTYYLIAAASGVGKSKLARYLFIHNPIMFLENNPDSDIQLDILYFSLEESKEKVILAEVSKYLYTQHKLNLSIKQLSSVGRYNVLSTEDLQKVQQSEEHVNNFLKRVKIFDNVRNATGIYKTVRDFALTIGTYYDKNDTPLTPQEVHNVKIGVGESYKKVSYYKTHNPKHYVIVLIDHISLLQPETGETLWQSMSKMSSNYCLHIRDKFGFIPVVVQQLAADENNYANCCAITFNYLYLYINIRKMEEQIIQTYLQNRTKTSKQLGEILSIPDYTIRKVLNKNGYFLGHYTPFSKRVYNSLTEVANQIIVGSLLGDGYISKYKDNVNSKLIIKHSYKQKPYSRYKKYLLSLENLNIFQYDSKYFDPRANKNYYSTCIGTSNSNFNMLRDNWYKEGKKIIPRDIKLSPLSLAIWFMDDGTKVGNSGYYLCTNNFLIEDVEFLQKLLSEDLGIVSRIHYNRGKPIIYIPENSVEKFNSHVYKYIHKSMKYKLLSA